jgi:hypothetical protein
MMQESLNLIQFCPRLPPIRRKNRAWTPDGSKKPRPKPDRLLVNPENIHDETLGKRAYIV